MVVCVDFDNVLYAPSEGDTRHLLMGKPMPGAMDFVCRLRRQGIEVVVLSARGHQYESTLVAMDWLKARGFPDMPFTALKPPAALYLDDKAMRFEGPESFKAALTAVLGDDEEPICHDARGARRTRAEQDATP